MAMTVGSGNGRGVAPVMNVTPLVDVGWCSSSSSW
jgi:hypothetical protein